MAGKSDYLELKFLDHTLGNSAYVPAGTTYIALFTASPSDAGGGTEVSGGSYARQALANNTTNWPAASNGSKSNGVTVTFPTSTAAWGTITDFGVYDAATGGNLLHFGPLGAPQTVASNNVQSFAPGTLVVTDSGKSTYLQNKHLDLVLGAVSFTAPTNVYHALFTTVPTNAGGGTEVSTGSYARAGVTNNGTNWPAASSGSKSNGTVIAWPSSTAAWGTITYVVQFDTSSAGNMLYYAALTTPQSIGTSNVFTLPVTALQIGED